MERRERAMSRRGFRPLLVLLLLLQLLSGVEAKKRKGPQATNMRKRECESTVCDGVSDDDRSNCVLECQSPECYAKVYAADELEPGEIDNKRSREFNVCLQNEMRDQTVRARARAATARQAQGAPSGLASEMETPAGREDPIPARSEQVEL